jgi:hypothetical protein
MPTAIQHPTSNYTEMAQWVRQLGARDTSQRLIAEEVLQEKAGECVEELLALAIKERKRWQRGSEILYNLFSAVVCFCMICVTSNLFSPTAHDTIEPLTCLGLAATGGVAYLLTRIGLSYLRVGPARAARALTYVTDTRAIGPLLDALPLGNATFQNMLEEALARLLPHLSSGDYLRLSDAQREKLYNLLLSGPHPLRLVILNLLKRAADGAALTHIRMMARSDKNPFLRSAAADFATFLEARFGAHFVYLLRPTQKPTNEHLLLRPAKGSIDVDSSRLLLASQPPGLPCMIE